MLAPEISGKTIADEQGTYVIMTCRKALYAFAFLVAQSLGTCAANGGDFAEREILGFSADGSLFAFEEYGIQDGSGFPYASIYLIETAGDTWTAGGPWHARVEEELGEVDLARNMAREMAGAALEAISNPGTHNASNPSLEVADNPHRIVARPWHFVPPTKERIEFRLEEIPMQGEEYCQAFGQIVGFRLLKIATRPNETTTVLHEDASVPKSRGCPLSYRFADIVTFPRNESGELVTAILILYEQVGFEGPDGRYLAVTKILPLSR